MTRCRWMQWTSRYWRLSSSGRTKVTTQCSTAMEWMTSHGLFSRRATTRKLSTSITTCTEQRSSPISIWWRSCGRWRLLLSSTPQVDSDGFQTVITGRRTSRKLSRLLQQWTRRCHGWETPRSAPVSPTRRLRKVYRSQCASGCVVEWVECRICSREVAGSNLGLGYFPPRSTQPSIPAGSVNEYQQRLGRQRQVWLIPIADERVGVHCAGKTVKSLENTCHTWALLRWWFTTKRRYIKCMQLTFTS